MTKGSCNDDDDNDYVFDKTSHHLSPQNDNNAAIQSNGSIALQTFSAFIPCRAPTVTATNGGGDPYALRFCVAISSFDGMLS